MKNENLHEKEKKTKQGKEKQDVKNIEGTARNFVF